VERAAKRLIGEVQVSVLLGYCCRPVIVCRHAYVRLFLTCRAL
jgi:hypothetical protein